MNASTMIVEKGREFNFPSSGLVEIWQMNFAIAQADALAASQGEALAYDYQFDVGCILYRVNGKLCSTKLSPDELELISDSIQQRIKLPGVRVASLVQIDAKGIIVL